MGIHIAFGQFRAIHLGDLTKKQGIRTHVSERSHGPSRCASRFHHGQPSSNSEVLVHAIHPRVAIMNNGFGRAVILM